MHFWLLEKLQKVFHWAINHSHVIIKQKAKATTIKEMKYFSEYPIFWIQLSNLCYKYTIWFYKELLIIFIMFKYIAIMHLESYLFSWIRNCEKLIVILMYASMIFTVSKGIVTVDKDNDRLEGTCIFFWNIIWLLLL